jgi:D-arabinose 1-dehydrogenase-like Zn-dependent alcohol dehydrogenase
MPTTRSTPHEAWVVQNYKQPLELTDPPEPSSGDHDVLVEIHTTAVTCTVTEIP